MSESAVLTANDFATEQDVRWCPGCGDYSILAQMKKMLPGLGVAPDEDWLGAPSAVYEGAAR